MRSFNCFNSSATVGLGGGTALARVPNASNRIATSKDRCGQVGRILSALTNYKIDEIIDNVALAGLLGEVYQHIEHRFAGHSHNTRKRVVEFQNDKDGAGDGERTGDESQSACGVGRR